MMSDVAWLCERCMNVVRSNTIHKCLSDSPRIEKLKSGHWEFGHEGRHVGIGTEECPRTLHHHHDMFCELPTEEELKLAGVNPEEFRARSRWG